MKKVVVIPALLMVVVIMIGADMRKNAAALTVSAKKKPCYGYTIIEFGKGINCHGDTIKLEKVMGGQELAKRIRISETILGSK
jgi:hypothetical protein